MPDIRCAGYLAPDFGIFRYPVLIRIRQTGCRISGIRQTDCRISGSSKDGKVVLLGLQPRRGKFKIKILDYSSKLPISGRISGLRQTGCRISGSGRPPDIRPDIRNPVERPNPDPVLIRRPNFRSGTTLL